MLNTRQNPAPVHEPAQDEREAVLEICRDMRGVFEKVLEASGPKQGKAGGDLVRGTCLYACVLLRKALVKFAGCTVQVRGGDGLEDGCVIDEGGRARGHYWLEGTTAAGERFLVDITADQFGLPPITLLWPEDSWDRYRAGDDAVVAEHATEIEADLVEAARHGVDAVGPLNPGEG